MLSKSTLFRCLAYLLALSAAPADAAPPTPMGRVSAAQFLEGLDHAKTDPRARELLAAYVNGAVEAADAASKAAEKKLICAEPGKESFDAERFASLLRKRAPTAKAQASLAATPVLVEYLMRKYPCR